MRRAGADGVLAEFRDQSAVRGFYAEARRREQAGLLQSVCDIVPAALTILFDGVSDVDALVRDLQTWRPGRVIAEVTHTVEIPVSYTGPDLADVARIWGVTSSEVSAIHTRLTHQVAFLGFAPGFAYIAGLPPTLSVERRPKPRAWLEGGSVALAGEYTGIYPRRSPGGWQIIGRTEVTLWDVDRDPAALLRPGLLVRFIDIDAP